jgi:predicted SAM-dependent methyltransferase
MILISPDGKSLTEREFMTLLHRRDIFTESVFRRHEMNLVIEHTSGTGVDIGCGLNKIHSQAVGIDRRAGAKDAGYPFGAQIRAMGDRLPWFADASLDYVFSSHCLEHLGDTMSALREWSRVLRPGGKLVLILPDKRIYPNVGQPGANPDHKHDFAPSDIRASLTSLGLRVTQLDTLQARLKHDPWAVWEAPKYGHPTLNFSFEALAYKPEKA